MEHPRINQSSTGEVREGPRGSAATSRNAEGKQIMTTFEYPVVLEPDDNDTILASVPDVPGVHSYGKDAADAIDHVREALIVMLSAVMDDNEDIPTPGKVGRGKAVVTLPTLVASKLMIYNAMKDQGVTRSELARRLGGKNPTHITRLLNVLHQSRHDQIDEALAMLDQRLVVEAKPTRMVVSNKGWSVGSAKGRGGEGSIPY